MTKPATRISEGDEDHRPAPTAPGAWDRWSAVAWIGRSTWGRVLSDRSPACHGFAPRHFGRPRARRGRSPATPGIVGDGPATRRSTPIPPCGPPRWERSTRMGALGERGTRRRAWPTPTRRCAAVPVRWPVGASRRRRHEGGDADGRSLTRRWRRIATRRWWRRAAWALGEAGSQVRRAAAVDALELVVAGPTPTPCAARRPSPRSGPSATPGALDAVLVALEDKPAVRRRAAIALAAFDDPRGRRRPAALPGGSRLAGTPGGRGPARPSPDAGPDRAQASAATKSSRSVSNDSRHRPAPRATHSSGVSTRWTGTAVSLARRRGHAPQQRPAPDEMDALEDDVLGQLGGRLAQTAARRR